LYVVHDIWIVVKIYNANFIPDVFIVRQNAGKVRPFAEAAKQFASTFSWCPRGSHSRWWSPRVLFVLWRYRKHFTGLVKPAQPARREKESLGSRPQSSRS
jgi:hypothetical protein